MKRVLLIALVGILLFANVALAQNGLIAPAQIANQTLSATAAEDLAIGDIVRIINAGGVKAYKYLRSLHSFGTPVYLQSGGADMYFASACLIDSTHVFVAFTNATASKGYGVIGTYTAPSTIAFGTPVYLQSGGANMSYASACLIDSTHVFVAFRDANAGKGYGVIGNIPLFLPSHTSMIPAMSNAATSANATGSFTLLSPYTVIHNAGFNYTPGGTYFLQPDNTVTTTVNANYYIGFALDTTSIFIDPYPYNQTAASTVPVSLQRK